MKKLTYYILSAVFAICNLSSCLDEDPIYSQNSAVIFSSESNAELALLGCYGYLTNSAAYGQMMQEALILSSGFGWGQRNVNDDGRMLSLESPTSASPIKTVWNGMYKVVAETNAFLASLDKSGLSKETKLQMGGEAKFLRGLAYYNLVMLFGDVPLKIVASSSEGISAARTPKEEIFAQIIQDMTDATLIAAKSADGRANSWAAKAFLGKVYHKMACLDIDAQANWQKAKDMFDDVYANGPYALEPKFGKLFGDFVTGSKESVFQLNFSVNSTVCFNRASNRFAPSQSTSGIAWGTYRATKAIYDLHEGTYPGDPRIELTFMKAWRTRGGNNQKDPKPMIGDVPTPNDSTYVYPYGAYTYVDQDDNPIELVMKNGEPALDKNGKKIGLMHVVKLPYADFPDPKNPSLEIIRNYVKTHGDSGPNATIVKMAKWYSTDAGQFKWPHYAKMYDQNQVGTASHKNLMVYRYAEMLLLMADVYNELGNSAKAIDLANEVLGRARTSGVTTAAQPADWSKSLGQEEVRTKLFFERIIELAGEPGTYEMPRIRGAKYFKMALELNNKHEFTIASSAQYYASNNVWHDRVFNVGKEGGEGLSDDFVKKNLLMPIPDSEISANPGITNDDNNFGY